MNQIYKVQHRVSFGTLYVRLLTVEQFEIIYISYNIHLRFLLLRDRFFTYFIIDFTLKQICKINIYIWLIRRFQIFKNKDLKNGISSTKIQNLMFPSEFH